MVKINKKAKKIMFIAIPIIIALIITTILIGGRNKKRASASMTTPDFAQEQMNVYLSSDDRTLVPLTIKYNQKETLGENILTVLNLIKEDSPIGNDTFHGLIPAAAKINELTLNDDKILNIDFDAGLFEYQPMDEVNLLASITWTMTEFPEIDAVSLSIDQEPLTRMPRNYTPVAHQLTRAMGINHFLVTSTLDLLNATSVLSYYTKTIDHQNYLIPVTQYVDNENNLSLYDLTISKLLEKPAITTRLKIAPCFEGITLETASTLADHVLQVSLNEKALFDEASVQTDIYNLIMASLDTYQEIEKVSFIINDQEVPVNGIVPDETFSVSGVVFNEFYI